MGNIRNGPPKALVRALKNYFEIKEFIESGTHEGGSAEWAAAYFERVTTIELSSVFHQRAATKLRKIDNVNLIHGDSSQVLAKVVPTLQRKALFWLDAHWSGGNTAGGQKQCPLLEELAVICQSHERHVVLIDDARLFCAPPPAPQDPMQWPSIAEVVNALVSEKSYIFIHDDVIVAVPNEARQFVGNWLRAQASSQVSKSRFSRFFGQG